MKHNIISFSGGKDSTRLVHLLIEQNIPIHSAVLYVTPWEFPEMESHVDLVQKKTGITIVKLYKRRLWSELLPKWKWPSGGREWCTSEKTSAVNRYVGSVGMDAVEYIGFSADEIKRTTKSGIKKKKHTVKFPLIDAGITEKQALQDCLNLGYNWGGLYEIYNRVSCFCCPKKGKEGLRLLRKYRPELYQKVLEMDKTVINNGGFGYSRSTVHDFEKIFQEEDKQMKLF